MTFEVAIIMMNWSDHLSEFVNETLVFIHHHYVDIYYVHWLAWVFYPLYLTFLLPIVLMLFLYASSLFLHIYKLRHHLKAAVNRDRWDAARHIVAALWDGQGRIWHGYELIGAENIPKEGSALLIFYHGAIPVDLYYLVSRYLLSEKRMINAVGDRFLFKIPGLRLLLEVFGVTVGDRENCVKMMKSDSKILAIAPGGVREAYFSDEYYQLMWAKRKGFARIALEARVPIVPVFTQNCREAVRAVRIGRPILRKIYEWTRLPIVPLYGGFPVKLRTFIGRPIPFNCSLSSEELVQKTKDAIENLIKTHQRVPGSIFQALADRFTHYQNSPASTSDTASTMAKDGDVSS